MILYVAGEIPNEEWDNRIHDVAINLGEGYNRLVSFFYKPTVASNMKLKDKEEKENIGENKTINNEINPGRVKTRTRKK